MLCYDEVREFLMKLRTTQFTCTFETITKIMLYVQYRNKRTENCSSKKSLSLTNLPNLMRLDVNGVAVNIVRLLKKNRETIVLNL